MVISRQAGVISKLQFRLHRLENRLREFAWHSRWMLVWKSSTGEGELPHKHKYLNVGHHRKMTWRHLSNSTGGFPDIDLSSPDGEMGDILSNYSKRPPGGEFEYSDGGMWRLAQALTKLWGKDL